MEDNTFLNADNLYEEVEGEAGKTLTLKEDQERNLIGIIKDRYSLAEMARDTDERRWIKATRVGTETRARKSHCLLWRQCRND